LVFFSVEIVVSNGQPGARCGVEHSVGVIIGVEGIDFPRIVDLDEELTHVKVTFGFDGFSKKHRVTAADRPGRFSRIVWRGLSSIIRLRFARIVRRGLSGVIRRGLSSIIRHRLSGVIRIGGARIVRRGLSSIIWIGGARIVRLGISGVIGIRRVGFIGGIISGIVRIRIVING